MIEPQERVPQRVALACGIASGALYALAEPPAAAWPLAFACLVPLGSAFAGRGVRARIALGGLTGAVAAWTTSLAPAGVGLAEFFGRSLGFGFAAAAATGAFFGGVGFAVFGALAGDPSRGRPALCACRFGVAFAAGEWVRSHVATGLPWLLLAHALAPAPRTAQLAAWIGTGGLGLLLAVGNGSLALLVVRGDARRAAAAIAAALALGFAAADAASPRCEPGEPGSIARAASSTPKRDGALRTAIVQPATPIEWMREPGKLRTRLDRLVELSQRALPADLVVWPENAFGAALPANEATVRERVATLFPRPALLFGAPRYDPATPTRLHNAVLLWDASGRAVGTYDKEFLLPFTEYVPAPFAALGVGGGHTTPGDAPKPLSLGGTSLGVLICYELLFPELARQRVAAGAGILVNPSNDAWFGATAGSEQMLAAGVLRAIESRRPLLRATPNGTSAAIDARGRVVARLPRGAAGAVVLDVWPGLPGR